MKIDVYTQEGKKLKTKISLEPKIFGVKLHPSLLAQYVRVYRFNQRQGTASAKTRGEVSGGGRKPWRQKGTGRARHGSIRSPLWVGGGKAHGPKPKSWSLKLPKKMKKGALLMALSEKVALGKIYILAKFSLRGFKTKEFAEILKNLSLGEKTLVILGEDEKKLFLPARNIAALTILPLKQLNAYEVLKAKSLLISKSTIKLLEEALLGRKRKT